MDSTTTANTNNHFLVGVQKVKWFYKLDDDSFKHLKRYGDKKWICFNKLDSYNLEMEYRLSKSNRTKPNLIQVLEGLYEVNLVKRICYPIYWEADSMPVMRSLWYTDNGEPFDEKTSDQIEQKHIDLFRDDILTKEDTLQVATFSEEILKPAQEPLATLNVDLGTVIWYSRDEIYLEKSRTNLFEIMHSKMSKIKHQIKLNRIKRCIKHAEDDREEIKFKEVTHLIFVVHGMAQKLQKNKIIECCNAIRRKCEKKKKEYFPTNENERFMFLPVDWRTSLVLDDGIVEAITIKTIKYVRHKLNFGVS